MPSEDETRHDRAYEPVLFAHSSTYRSKYFDPEPSSSLTQETSVDPQGDTEDNKRCPICGATFTRMGDKRRHEMKHKPGPVYPCTECPKSFYRRDKLRAHQRSVHEIVHPPDPSTSQADYAEPREPEVDLDEFSAGTPTRSQPDLSNPAEKFVEAVDLEPILLPNSTKCRLCGREFSGNFQKTNYRRHVRTIHEGIRTTCPVEECGETLSRSDNLKKHLEIAHAYTTA